MSDVKEAYKKISFQIPSFEEINGEFEIEEIETSFILRNVLRKAAEKVEFYVGILSEILQPDTASLSGMHETRFFTEAEKEKLYSLFKRLMKSHRAIIESVLGKTEEDQAAFLKEFFNDWKTNKIEILALITNMKDSWDKEIIIQKDVEYFG